MLHSTLSYLECGIAVCLILNAGLQSALSWMRDACVALYIAPTCQGYIRIIKKDQWMFEVDFMRSQWWIIAFLLWGLSDGSLLPFYEVSVMVHCFPSMRSQWWIIASLLWGLRDGSLRFFYEVSVMVHCVSSISWRVEMANRRYTCFVQVLTETHDIVFI